MNQDSKAFERMLEDAENRLERLRALYEQWFQGLERLEPTIPRKNFDRLMDQLRRNRPRTTGLKFRYQNLVSRYTTYVTYWRKVARQIEEGTYRRDIMRARKTREEAREKHKRERELKKAIKGGMAKAKPETPETVQQPASATPVEEAEPAQAAGAAKGAEAAVKPAAPSGPASCPLSSAPSGPAAPALASGALPEQKMRSIYDRYVNAKSRNNERVNVNYERLAGKVAATLLKLQKKHAGKQIDFEVVVRNGRVALKPVVKR